MISDVVTEASSTPPAASAPPGAERTGPGLVAEGQDLVRECLRRGRPGQYQVQAAIAAVRSDAPSAAGTDWRQVLGLYDLLLAMSPTPVGALHRAVAVAEMEGPGTARGTLTG